jgi:hypothetical protein
MCRCGCDVLRRSLLKIPKVATLCGSNGSEGVVIASYVSFSFRLF